jgi:hypothetical protein
MLIFSVVADVDYAREMSVSGTLGSVGHANFLQIERQLYGAKQSLRSYTLKVGSGSGAALGERLLQSNENFLAH